MFASVLRLFFVNMVSMFSRFFSRRGSVVCHSVFVCLLVRNVVCLAAASRNVFEPPVRIRQHQTPVVSVARAHSSF